MWELDYKESWVPKNWCSWTVVLEKTLGSPLDCKEIQPVHCKGAQSWVFIGRTDAEAPILWQPDVKCWLIGKYWCWGRLRAGEGDDRGGDGWMASPTRRTWIWVDSGSWWRPGRPGVLQSMGLQSRIWMSDWTESFDVLSPWFLLQKLLWSLAPPSHCQSSPLELSKRLSSGLKSSESLPNKTGHNF